jgi:hypothetical protein
MFSAGCRFDAKEPQCQLAIPILSVYLSYALPAPVRHSANMHCPVAMLPFVIFMPTCASTNGKQSRASISRYQYMMFISDDGTVVVHTARITG